MWGVFVLLMVILSLKVAFHLRVRGNACLSMALDQFAMYVVVSLSV